MSLRRLLVTLGIALAVLAPATAAPAAPTAPTAPARPVSPDADFLIAAHQANLAQVKLGRLAARKGTSATVRDLGREFTTYHRTLDASVRKAAAGLGVNLPKTPNSEQQDLLKEYRIATGAGFDGLFVGSQLLAHERALKLTKIVLATGTEPTVRHIVTTARPVIRKHYAALTAMRHQNGDTAGQ